MKVLQILGHTTGGIGSHVKSLSEDLKELGEQVHILSPKEVANNFQFENYTVVWPSIGLSPSKIFKFIQAMKIYNRYIRISDVVHIHGNQAAFFALLACRKIDRNKIIVTLHNKIILTGLKEKISKISRLLVIRRSKIVSGVSSDLIAEVQKDNVKQTFIAPIFAPRVEKLLKEDMLSLSDRAKNFQDLYNTLSDDEKRYFDVNKPLIVSICRIAPQKAIEDIVKIANSGIDANFVVIGDGVDSLLNDLKKLDTGNRVFFAGRRENVEVFLKASNVMLLTSKWEGCPLVLQEAMANGLPIVSTFGGGIPDLVYDDNTGLKGGILCNVADWQNMGLSIQTLLEDKNMWQEYCENGRAIASTWKTRIDIAKFWQKVYRDL